MNEMIKIIEGYNREKEQINDYFSKMSGSMYEVDKLKVDFYNKRLSNIDSKLDKIVELLTMPPQSHGELTHSHTKGK